MGKVGSFLAPVLLEIHYKPGCTMDMAGVKEIHEVRNKIFTRPYGSISLIPDDVDFQLDITKRDHYAGTRTTDLLRAWVVVARGHMLEMIAKLYFSYFPQTFPVMATANEADAQAWMDAQLDNHARQVG